MHSVGLAASTLDRCHVPTFAQRGCTSPASAHDTRTAFPPEASIRLEWVDPGAVPRGQRRTYFRPPEILPYPTGANAAATILACSAWCAAGYPSAGLERSGRP